MNHAKSLEGENHSNFCSKFAINIFIIFFEKTNRIFATEWPQSKRTASQERKKRLPTIRSDINGVAYIVEPYPVSLFAHSI